MPSARRAWWAAAGCVALAGVLFSAAGTRADCPAPPPYTPPKSTFDQSDENWTLVNADGTTTLSFIPKESNPDRGVKAVWFRVSLMGLAYLWDPSQGDDESAMWYYRAPVAFRGDHRPVLHGKLAFEVQTCNLAAQTHDVFLRGGGLLLVHPLRLEHGSADQCTRTTVEFGMDEAAGWVIADTEQAATRAQWKQVLADVQDVQIPATWVNGGFFVESVLNGARFDLPDSGRVRLNSLALHFGRVRVGRTRRKTLIVANRSRRQTLYVHVGALAESVEFFPAHPDQDVDIPPRHHLKVRVAFVAQLPGSPARADLQITTSDPDFRAICVPLTGVGR